MATPSPRRIDQLIEEYPLSSPGTGLRILEICSVLLLSFGLLGMIWALPFPHLDFLGRYNGFINWASFLIAIAIYYYYRLSPVLSYVVLLMVFAFSAGIVTLEKVQAVGVQGVGLICMLLFLAGNVMQYNCIRRSQKRNSVNGPFYRLQAGPLWLASLIFRPLGLRY